MIKTPSVPITSVAIPPNPAPSANMMDQVAEEIAFAVSKSLGSVIFGIEALFAGKNTAPMTTCSVISK